VVPRDGRLQRERGATQRETLDKNAIAHPHSPVKGGKGGEWTTGGGTGGGFRNSMGRKRGENGTADERGRKRDAPALRERNEKGNDGRLARASGDGKVLGSTFLRDVGG